MRKSARALLLAAVSLLGTMVLALGAAFTAAFASGAVALIVPGTGTPNANVVSGYLQNVENYYLRDTACTGSSCTLRGIDYPASFYPLAIIPGWCRSGPEGCDKWDESVGQGVDGGPLGPGLNQELANALAISPEGGRDIVVFGYSQGGAVVSKLLNESNLTPEQKQRIHVVTIGGIENPDGGLWQRLAFLKYIPILDITFAPPMPVDPDLKTTTIGFEYDPVVYAPRYWGNPLALLNAFAAFATVHGDYLEPNGKDGSTPGALPYGYTPPTATDPGTLVPQLDCGSSGSPQNCRYDKAGNAYIMIPATSLPMYDLALSLLPPTVRTLAKPFVDLVTPVTKVLVDLGYDWSGDPGTPTPLSILPFKLNQNFAKVVADLFAASIRGVQDFAHDLGGPDAPNQGVQGVPTVSPPRTQTLLANRPEELRDGVGGGVANVTKVVANPASKLVPGAVDRSDESTRPATQAGSPGLTGVMPVDQELQNLRREPSVAATQPVRDTGLSQSISATGGDDAALHRPTGTQRFAPKTPQDRLVGDFAKKVEKSVTKARDMLGPPAASKPGMDGKPASDARPNSDGASPGANDVGAKRAA